MYWLYIGIGILLFLILVALLVRYVSNVFETFQNEVEDEITQLDISGVDLEKLARQLPNIQRNTTDIDSRPVNDTSRICDTLQSQIDTLQANKENYKSIGDWSNVRLSNKTIEPLKEQMTTLGCQNNNSQNN
jgi:hypothetical protein